MSFSHNPNHDRLQARIIRSAYSSWVEDLVADGYTGYLLTFMFKNLPARTQGTKIEAMHRDIELVYHRLAPRFAHHPKKPSQRRYLPLMMASPDLPVAKQDKSALADVIVNDGLHEHAILLTPPWVSRFKYEFATWMQDHSPCLLPETWLHRIHCIRLDVTPGKATDYALKAHGGRLDADTLLILPKALSERSQPTDKGYDEAVRSSRGASLMRTRWKPY